MYTSDMPWAVERPPCNETAFRDCGRIVAQCKSTNSDSDAAYETAWRSCRAVCAPQDWEQHCEAACEPINGHAQKCQHIAAAVQFESSVVVSHANGVAWTAGDRCRSVDVFCGGSCASMLNTTGFAAALGLLFLVLAAVCLLLRRCPSEPAPEHRGTPP